MELTRRQGIMLGGTALVAGRGASSFAADTREVDGFRALLEESAQADRRRAALSALPRPAPFVDPLSDSYMTALRRDRGADNAALSRVQRDRLSSVDRIAYDVFAYKTRQEIDFIDRGLFDVARRAPLDASFGLQVEFADFVAGAAPFATVADYEAGLLRLAGFVDYLQSVLTRLGEGLAVGQVQPRIIVTNVLAEVDAMLALPIVDSPFYAAIRKLPDTIPPAERERLAKAYAQLIERRVYPGYAAWKRYLTDTYLPRASVEPGRWAMKGGAALYRAELARHITTDTPPDAVHALGLSEVARIRQEMEDAKARTGFEGALPAFFEFIRSDPRFYCKTPEELLGRFAAIEARIWQAMPKLFARRPKAPFEVRGLPALGEQRGTGYYRPGPPDGRSPGILFFNMAMLGTRPIPTLETLTLHEGIPGHHFQINLARENKNLPKLLAMPEGDGFTAYAEGWGLYSESLGRALGMFDDPYQWFGHLDMEMLRAVRLVVDTGLHAQRWNRKQAIDYMLANTSMAARDVTVEIDRYISAPGQACAYKMG